MAERIPIADAHQDIAWDCLKSGRDFALDTEGKALSLPALEAGGVRLVCATIFTADAGNPAACAEAARAQLAFYEDLCRDHPDRIARAEKEEDLADLDGDGPIRMVLSIEGAEPLARVDELQEWRERGVVSIGPIWNTTNRYGGGADASYGLSPDGFALVRVAGTLGMAIDLSHLNPTAFDAAIDAAMGPVYASHSNAAALCPHRRNLSDIQLRKIAAADGIVGLMGYGPFLEEDAEQAIPVERLFQHLDHVSQLIGVDNVCLGTDFDGGFGPEKGIREIPSAAHMQTLVAGLQARECSEEAIRDILGGNLRRFIAETFS